MIIDSASQVRSKVLNSAGEASPAGPKLLLVSANTQYSLKNQVVNVKNYIASHPARIEDVAYTLTQRREHLPHRSFFLAGEDMLTTDASPAAKVAANPPGITMVFSGQGAQWPEMGASLMKTDINFRTDIQEMDKILQSFIHAPLWTIEGKFVVSFNSMQATGR